MFWIGFEQSHPLAWDGRNRFGAASSAILNVDPAALSDPLSEDPEI